LYRGEDADGQRNLKRRITVADEDKNKDKAGTVEGKWEKELKEKKEFTAEDLITLVKNGCREIFMSEEFVKLGDLKARVEELVKPIATKVEGGEKALADALKMLENLPGKDGDKNITPNDSEFKGLHKTGGYECEADFARDVYFAGLREGEGPSAIFRKWATDVDTFRKAFKTAGTPTLEIGDPEQGGYLIPPEFSTKLLTKGFENSNFINRCMKVPMQRNQVSMPFQKDFDHTTYLHGAMQAYWLDEKAGKTATKPKFGSVTLRLNKLAIMIYSTDEMLEDSAISMQPLLTTKAYDVIGWKLDEAILRGTGAGQPLGIIGTGNPSRILVTKEGGQANATIVYNNVTKMWSRMYPRSLRSAIFVANSNIFPQLATLSIPVGTGGSAAYLPANGLSGKPYDSLMGKELVFTEHASTLGTVGDLSFIDFGEYLIGQKRGAGAGVQFAKSIHLYFLYDQTAFRYVLRVDGQPWWPAVFTPKRGSTQSPFVVLGGRP